MKTIVAASLAVSVIFAGSASARSGSHVGGSATGPSSSSHPVSGYANHDGTYVAPYRATDPNGTQRGNYNAEGSVNPYNGLNQARHEVVGPRRQHEARLAAVPSPKAGRVGGHSGRPRSVSPFPYSGGRSAIETAGGDAGKALVRTGVTVGSGRGI